MQGLEGSDEGGGIFYWLGLWKMRFLLKCGFCVLRSF